MDYGFTHRLKRALAHEWAKNALAMLIVSGALALLFAVVLLRPALLVGVDDDGDALAQSLGRKVGQKFENCADRANGLWICRARRTELAFELDVNWMGCWHAEQVSSRSPRQSSGCIGFFDVLGSNDVRTPAD